MDFFSIPDAQEASVSSISPDQMLNPGDDVVLNCSVVNPNKINVSWLKDNTMFTLGSLLVFQNPRIRISFDESTNTYSLHVSEPASLPQRA
jgi:Immunoglobulin I-set domain